MAASEWESHVSFKALVDFLESVTRQTDRKRKVEQLRSFLNSCRTVMGDYGRKEGPASADDDDVDSLFPVMRLLLPAIDRGRGPYGIKETLLAKVLDCY